MRKWTMFLLIAFLVSCSDAPQKNNNSDNLPLAKKEKKSDKIIWEEGSEEDFRIEQAIDEALIKTAFALQRARLLAQGNRITSILKIADKKNKLEIYQASATKEGAKPHPVKLLEEYELPEEVKFKTIGRVFYYDINGNIDFIEEDQQLQANPPKADLYIIPKSPENPRIGLVDVIKTGAVVKVLSVISQGD